MLELIHGVMALAAVARRVSAVVVDQPVDRESLAGGILGRGGIPAVGAVAGLAAWGRPLDKLLVDGGAGEVRVNPTAQQVARLRRTGIAS